MDAHDYEVLVIGGGPAGLSAALYLARFNRRVALFDSGRGRSGWGQMNYNYLGFPGGISVTELRARAREQVAAYPQVTILEQRIEELTRDGDLFTARGPADAWRAQALILCTGVVDQWPQFDGWEEYVGHSVFWCLTCDGYSSRGMRLVVVGSHDEAACTALQLQRFTPHVMLLTNSADNRIPPAAQERLEAAGIPLIHDQIERVTGHDGQLAALFTTGGLCIELDRIFSQQGAAPQNALALALGVKVNEAGYIVVDTEQKTSVPFVYAAGDVTYLHSHQVATAVHEGAQAASAANYELYPPELKAL